MRRTLKAGDLTFLIVALVLMIVLASISYLIAPPQTMELRGSTYSANAEGAKAAFLTLKQLGYEVERSYEPIAALRGEPSDAVLVIASPLRRASLQDLRAMRSFLDRGGVAIATGGGGSFLPDLGSVSIVERSMFPTRGETPMPGRKPGAGMQAPPAVAYHAAMPSLLTRHAPTVSFEIEILGAAPMPASYTAVYANADGPGVLIGHFGDGVAIWAIGSTPFLNQDIDKPGHLELLLNAIGSRERRVLWDEYYHGYDRGLISYLATTQLSTAFAQLALMAIAALMTFSRRRGPLRPLFVRPRASAMEFVDAISALYQKARASSGAVETMRARLRRVLIVSSQMPASSSDAQLAAAAAVRYPIDEGDVKDVLAASAAASDDQSLPADRALVLVRRMQTIAAKILK